MSHRAQHAYRDRHKHDRCGSCGSLYSGPYSKCDACRAKQKAAYESKKREGICPRCNNPSSHGVLCDNCRLTTQAERIAAIILSTTPAQPIKINKTDNLPSKKQKYPDFPSIQARTRFYANQQSLKRRQKVLDAYGRICKCCNETTEVFLTIDHMNNDGAEHRRNLGNGDKSLGSSSFYRWLITNNFPEGFQVLCWNCNRAKYLLGVCPHQSNSTTSIHVDS